MCVALPGLVVGVGPSTAVSTPGTIRIGDVERPVELFLVPGTAPGDYVIVHSGYAIRRLSPDEAAAFSQEA